MFRHAAMGTAALLAWCVARPVPAQGIDFLKAPGERRSSIFDWPVRSDDAKPEEAGDRMATNRPDFTEASTNVGAGRVQVEMGYTYTRDNFAGVRTREHSVPEFQVRIGLFADWLELVVGQNYLSNRTTQGRVRTTVEGADDLYLGLGLQLTRQAGILPESRIVAQLFVPSGADGITANRTLAGFNYLYGWEVNDFLSTAGSFGMNRSVDDTDNRYWEINYSHTIGYTLTKNLNAYTEFFALLPSGSRSASTVAQYYADGGFQYFLSDNFAFDVRAGVGLNRHANDFFTGVGFAFRY